MKVFLAIILTTMISMACAGYKSASSPPVANYASPIVQPSSAEANTASQDKSACGLDLSQAPVLHGLKLGMNPDEVLDLFPGSKDDPEVRSHLSRPPNQFGTSSLLIRPSKYAAQEKFTEISQITFTLLDRRVSKIHVGFNGPEWPHVDKFVTKFIEGTNLPAVDQWEAYVGLDNQLKILKCADFEVRVFAGGTGGNLNYVQLQDLEADKKMKERRKKAQEQASPKPGKQ